MKWLRSLLVRLTVSTDWHPVSIHSSERVVTADGETLTDCFAYRRRVGSEVEYRRSTSEEAEQQFEWWATR